MALQQEDRERQSTEEMAETRDKYFRLFDRMVTLTPEEYRDGTRRLREQITATTSEIQLA